MPHSSPRVYRQRLDTSPAALRQSYVGWSDSASKGLRVFGSTASTRPPSLRQVGAQACRRMLSVNLSDSRTAMRRSTIAAATMVLRRADQFPGLRTGGGRRSTPARIGWEISR